MNPFTMDVLRAEADLAAYAQAHPTDSKGINALKVTRNKAVFAWAQAGCPDYDGSKPAVQPKADKRNDTTKDWTPAEVMIEVMKSTEKAVLASNGYEDAWAPRSVIKDRDGDVVGYDLSDGDLVTVYVPAWLVEEAKW